MESRELLKSYRAGEDYTHDEVRAALDDFASYLTETEAGWEKRFADLHRRLNAYEVLFAEAALAIATMGQQANEIATPLYETWSRDPWLMGHHAGEAFVWCCVSKALTTFANAMHRREHVIDG